MSRSAQSQRQAPHDRQNNSARPSARHIAAQSPVSHTPRHAAPPAAPRKTLGPAAMPGAPPQPRHENSPVSRAPPRRATPPRLPRRREKVWPATRRAMPQADRGPPKRAPYGSHTAPRPATKIVLLVARRAPIALSAAPQKTLGPAAMPGAPPQPRRKNNPAAAPPSQSTRPPSVRAGGAFPFVRFVPSSSMSRSTQSQEPRRTIVKTTARYGMGRSAARMVSGEHRKSRSARPQEPPRSRPRQAAPVQSAASSSALGS